MYAYFMHIINVWVSGVSPPPAPPPHFFVGVSFLANVNTKKTGNVLTHFINGVRMFPVFVLLFDERFPDRVLRLHHACQETGVVLTTNNAYYMVCTWYPNY